ncbi:hypothetical protein Tco_0943095 [Tanacetum coccineum]
MESHARECIDQNTYHVNNETSNGNTENYKILNIALKHENVAIAKILQRLVSRFALGDDSQIITEQLPGPDISYVVHKLSQAMHGPLKSDLKLAFRVLRYLKGALGMRVLFKASDSFELTAFVDSDWSKCIATRRSVTGFAVFLGSCLVSWKSKKQSVLAKSSAESEYRAMSNVACEIIWVLKILTDLKVEYTILVEMFCDSSAAMQIAANPVFHEKNQTL